MSLRWRLLLITLIALLPAILIQAYNEFALRRDRAAEVREQALRAATLASSEIERIFEGVRNLLIAIAESDAVESFDQAACAPYLDAVEADVPHLLGITVLDASGRSRCDASGPLLPANGPGESYVARAMAGAAFVVGDYSVDSEGGPPYLPLAVPMTNGAGAATGVVAAALDLSWLSAQLRERGYPAGGSITAADRNGTIIARVPQPEEFVGTLIPPERRYLIDEPAPGIVDLLSQDGTPRILGYVPLAAGPMDVYVSAGLSTETAFASVNAATVRGVAMIVLTLIVALAAAAVAGVVFIRRPVDRLLAATGAWRDGDLDARTGLKDDMGEFGRIGAEVDRVVSAVQARGAELANSEERLRLAVSATGIGIWDVDARSGSRRWSPEFKAILGLDLDASADQARFAELIHPDDREWVNSVYTQAYADVENGHYDAEFRIRRANDGVERWVVTSGRITFGADGRAVRGVGTLRDVTERRTADAALRENEARLRALADNLPNGFVYQLEVLADGKRRIPYISDSVERLLGIRAEDLLVDPTLIFVGVPLEHIPGLIAAEAAATASMSSYMVETQLCRADGSFGWFLLSFAPRHISGGLIWDGVALDISARKVAESDLLALNETLEQRVGERTAELETANRQLRTQIEERERVEATLRQMQRLEAVGQLTAGVAHDFNNLLTVVLGNVGFLQQSTTEPRDLRRLGMIRSAAERGANLTQQLLAFSRRQRLAPRPLDLNETIAGMRDLLQSTLGGSLRVSIALEPGLWPALVDPTQIELVILNLVINARDASDVGGALTIATGNVVVSAPPSRLENPTPGEYVKIAVTDTGSGMSEDVLARAFEPFFTTKDVGKGSGLGLAQVFGFAKQSGGGVAVLTKLGEGTTVEVYLPRAAPAPMPVASAPVPREPVSPRHGGSVLIVDDDAAVRDVTAGVLRQRGFLVHETGSGAAGLELLRRETGIDIALVDFAMPGMNGAEFAREAHARWPGLPLIFLTGYADLTALADVPDERLVQKPIREDELFAKIGRLMAAAGRQSADLVSE